MVIYPTLYFEVLADTGNKAVNTSESNVGLKRIIKSSV